MAEVVVRYYLNQQYPYDFYISTLLFAPVLFVHVNQMPLVASNDDFNTKIYIAIYLLHPFVNDLVTIVLPNMPTHVRFIVTLFFLLLASANLIVLNRRVKVFL
ncbi:MAG: hypothetical protein HC896_04955 [Bacteroidales bacterium]|nr:hypothetical protein [Bacteroidales bacterium]